MKISYYPGCTLLSSAKEFDESSRAVLHHLDIEPLELPDWNCCGATSAHNISSYLAIALNARNLAIAEKVGLDVVIPCAACFNRLKAAEKALIKNEFKEFPFEGKIKVHNLLYFLYNSYFLDQISKKKKRSLSNIKAVAYYGCLVTRNPKITDISEYEYPNSMDEILKAVGVDCIPWAYKTDCCGAALTVARPEIVYKLVARLYDEAIRAGAECIAVACPLCHANLDMKQQEINKTYGKDYYIPIFYFTELLGLSFGLNETQVWFGRHFVDPKPFLKEKGYI